MKTQKSHTPHAKGFALVVTISLLVLLTVIAVGLLSLSAVTLRSSSQELALMEARANARLALQIAIGALQKELGPDQRISAPSSIIDSSSPPLLGVWKSWEGTDHESTGLPVAPVYNDKKRKQAEGGRFLAWLISGAATGGNPANPSALASKTPMPNTVPLLSTGTLGTSEEGQVHLVPQPAAGSGTLAWWVAGENQKARLPAHYEPADTAAGWSDLAKSHAVADPEPFGLDQDLLVVPSPADKAITLQTANLVAKNAVKPPSESFHDLSINSTGLLTNTATGGWRKDLSLVTENWDALPATNLPFFRLDANYTTNSSKPTPAASQAPQSIFYPWSTYWSVPTNGPIYQHGAVSTWHSLKDYATAYKRITAAGGGYSTNFTGMNILNAAESFAYLHRIRTTPVIARCHWLFSHRTRLIEGDPATTSDDTYNLELLITPVVTMWNPYNVTIASEPNIRIEMNRPIPCAFRHYDKDGNPLPQYRRVTRGFWDNIPGHHPAMPPGVDRLRYLIPSAFTLAAGETRVFSPTTTVGIGTALLNMSPGYRPGTGHSVNISYAGSLNAKSKVKVDVRFDARFKEVNNAPEFVGVWLDIFRGTGGLNYLQVHRMHYAQDTANKYWPPIPAADLAEPAAEEIKDQWKPFFSAVYGSRISGPSSTGLPGRGLLQASPLVSYMRLDAGYSGAGGGGHPANGASDFSFFAHPPGGDDKLPNANNTNNRGYIVSGFRAADGLSRVILNELPLRPLLSLAELQNWDIRSQNPVPPFMLNAIANSDATPLIPPAKILNTGGPRNLQHDDSYCANHLLFDDWIFSSLAPEPAAFGNAVASDLRTNYTRFLKGEKPLANRAYRRIAEDINLSDTKITERINDALSPDGWQRVASRFEVDGMFNVNSTSVKAWRALLGHARNQKIPHHIEGGIGLSGETDHALSRFAVAGDVKAGEQGMSGSFPESAEISGYRVFDDALLDILAEKTVEQVRLRGPFLSLSEFVNRQLSEDKNLALAGAIQTALNKMSEQAGSSDPYATLKGPDLSQDAGDPADPKLAGAGYLFPEAAVGKSNYGMPGWTRQADVLRPLAPILSARDDTFTIRAYGDARDKAGNILAKVWCEATVRRTRDFVDPADPADITTAPTGPANLAFGRRFSIVSFRWLSPEEV